MNIGTYLYLIILFVVFSPGITFSIPSTKKWVRVFTHGFLFSVTWLLTHRIVNNIWKNMNNSIREGVITTAEGTAVVDNNSQTTYTGPPPQPPPSPVIIDTVYIKGNRDYLSLAEVQVFDKTGKNVAFRKEATQSTNWDSVSGIASRAVDGNTSGNWGDNSTTHTATGDTNQLWQVKLGASYDIIKIIIHNRKDCCNHRLDCASLILQNGSHVVRTIPLSHNLVQIFEFPFNVKEEDIERCKKI